MGVYAGNLFQIPSLVKIAQIIFLLIIVSVSQAGDVYPWIAVSKHASCFGSGITVGYLLVYLILIICYAIGETGTQRSKFELILNVVGFLCFLSLSIYFFVKSSDYINFKYHIKTKLIVDGVFMLMTAACQLLDAVFIFRRGRE